MRELFPVDEESTEQSLVLRTEDGERFSLSRHLLGAQINQVADPGDHVIKHDSVSGSALIAEPSFDGAPDQGETQELVAQDTETVEPIEAEVVAEEEPATAVERSLPQPDPLYATPLSMRPSEIQQRIRAGATAQELADEMGVAVSRLDAYAHPVLLEREQVATAAKQSRPVREDGPAKLTLFEILATAFAARGHSLSEATWDAVREPGDSWVVRVSWKAGLSENIAEWSFKRSGLNATTEARNAIAADLTDPNFVKPVRSLSAVSSGRDDEEDDEHTDGVYDIENDLEDVPLDEHDSSETTEDDADNAVEDFTEGGFLRHPDPDQGPQKRKRKAVTPHWEDVLLGVRTNTKRPRK